MIKKYIKPKKFKIIDFNSEDLSSFTISDLKRICDYWLRQYLLNQSDSDYIFCPLKKRKFHSKEMEVAHFIDRGNMATRYDLDNCHLVSKQSNTWDAQIQVEGYKSLHHKDYEEYLGENIVKKLKNKAQKLVLMNSNDYICLIEKFRNV